ncbi:MAG TPA: hypothetical protein VD816_05900 [Ohtaekwangia sp.]|nr:hypothetical protein [Ohtaekwangia sp.]
MKHLTRLFTLLIFASAAVLLSNCGGDDKDGPSVEETQLNMLKATWTLEEASLDDVDRTADFADGENMLTLTISGNFSASGVYNYSFSGKRPNPSPWPASGTWSFVPGSETSQIERDDEVIVSYTVTANTLTMTFACVDCDYAGSRVESVNGPWEFVFSK